LARINNKLEEANETLENLSIKDHLTGLYNRRYFNTKIDELLNLAKRSGTYLTLMMLDVDRFKSINDNFGHLAGDYFLKDIGERITQELSRSTDFVSRFGGDEFAIILYDTSPEGARMIAEKIKEAVEDISVRSDFSSWEVKTTISMGLCSVIPEKNISSREIISATDDALYKAKQEGRDRICEGKINHE